jgi:ribokinase
MIPAMSHNAIVVTGSLNMDFVVQVERLPAPGETTLGSHFQMIPGGKGANQACAAGRLSRGSRVAMLGRVGVDPFADHLKAALAAAGVDVSTVSGTKGKATGVALIWVESSGQNSIVVAPGANGELSPADVESARTVWNGAKCALFQLETPLFCVENALFAARKAGATTILDPAPAQPLPARMLEQVDVLTPNESEACILLGRAPSRVTLAEAPALAAALRALGPKAVILKLGEQGCFYSDGAREIASPAMAVKPVDSTAAGDTFNGAFAVAIAEGQEIEAALRFANTAAAISVTRLGAQASIPTRAEVDEALKA